MTLRTRVIVIAGAVLVAALAIAYGIFLSVGDETPIPTGTSVPDARATASATPTPEATDAPGSTADPADPGDPAGPATIDPYYGDAVVEASSDGSADLATGLKVELVSVTATSITGSGIGSTSGPAIEVTVRVTNGTGAAASLAPVVNAYSGDERTPLTPDHDTPIASSIAASGESVGSYTFAVDDSSSTIWITVSTAPDSGLVLFEHNR